MFGLFYLISDKQKSDFSGLFGSIAMLFSLSLFEILNMMVMIIEIHVHSLRINILWLANILTNLITYDDLSLTQLHCYEK